MRTLKLISIAIFTISVSQISFAQDMSGWSDKTICRLAESQKDNALYLQEAISRNLPCANKLNNANTNKIVLDAHNHGDIIPNNIPITNLYTNGFIEARAYADIDNDGELEIFGVTSFGKQAGNPSVYELNADKTRWLTDSSYRIFEHVKGCIHPRKAIAEDFNLDGKVDFIVACHGLDIHPFKGEHNVLYTQGENHSFTASIPWNKIGFYHSISSADFNNDNYPDVVVTQTSNNKRNDQNILLYLNNQDGTFTRSYKYLPTSYANWARAYTLKTIDVNEDGLFDLFIAGHENENNGVYSTVWLNSGDNNFRNSKRIRVPKIKNWGIVLDLAYHKGTLYLLRTGDGQTGKPFYEGRMIQAYDIASKQSEIVVQHNKARWLPWLFKTEGPNGTVIIHADDYSKGQFELTIGK